MHSHTSPPRPVLSRRRARQSQATRGSARVRHSQLANCLVSPAPRFPFVCVMRTNSFHPRSVAFHQLSGLNIAARMLVVVFGDYCSLPRLSVLHRAILEYASAFNRPAIMRLLPVEAEADCANAVPQSLCRYQYVVGANFLALSFHKSRRSPYNRNCPAGLHESLSMNTSATRGTCSSEMLNHVVLLEHGICKGRLMLLGTSEHIFLSFPICGLHPTGYEEST